MIRIPTHRAPTHPGEMLFEEFLKPMGIAQRKLADSIRVPCRTIDGIVNGQRAITPGIASRLSGFFGVSPGFWMNIQFRWDLYCARRSEEDEMESIRPIAKDGEPAAVP